MFNKPIVLTIFSDPDRWLRENLPDINTDGIAACQPIESINLGGNTRYIDQEEGIEKICTWEDHVTALRLLCEQVGKTLFVGDIKNPADLTDAGCWDVEVADAYFQLVYRQEVIYG